MEFKNIEIDNLLKIVNEGLEEGLSIVKIATRFGVNESSIRKKLMKAGYKREGNMFVLQVEGHTVPKVEKTNVKAAREKIVVHEGGTVLPIELKENFINLMSNYDVLIDMINSYKNTGVVHEGGIVVQLPKERNSLYKTSVRINDVVYEEFRSFCNDHKEFTMKELHSMALLEFMNKYK